MSTLEIPVVRTMPRGRWIALGVVLLAAFLDSADGTIVTVVLPDIQRHLGTTYAVAQWALAGYALGFALLLITGGRFGDIFGRKRVFLFGVVGFIAASAACGAAWAPEVLIAGRVVQGVAAALMVPQVMSVVVTEFRQEEWALAGAIMGAVLAVGNMSGPLLGGVLTDVNLFGLGWRVIFYVNVPVGLLAVVLAAAFMREHRSDRPLRLDMRGVLLLTLAMLALMYPLVQGRGQGWPAWMFVLMGSAVPLLAVFGHYQVRRHRRDASALVPPTLFRHRSFTVGLVAVVLTFSGIGSLFMVLSYQLQLGLHWSVLRTALAMLAWPVGILGTFQIALRARVRDERSLVAIGLLVMAVGTGVMVLLVNVFQAEFSWPHAALANLVIGLGMGLCSPILTRIVLGDVPASDAGAGSGVVNAVVQLGTAAGIAVVGMIFFGLVGNLAGADVTQFSSATSTALWYNIVAFLLTAALCPLLPASARARS